MKSRVFSLFLPVLILVSCASNVHVKHYANEIFPTTSQVDVLDVSPPAGTYINVAEISVEQRADEPLQLIKEKAMMLGAHAIVMMGERSQQPFMASLSGDLVGGGPQDEMWALAIRYKHAFTPQTSQSAQIPEVPQVAQSSQIPPAPPSPQQIGTLSDGSEAVFIDKKTPSTWTGKGYYAVVEVEKMYSDADWSGFTNFTLLTKTKDREACQAQLNKGARVDQKFVDCVEAGGWFEQVFRHETTGNWYVTIKMADAYEGAAIIDFGVKQSLEGRKVEWTDEDERHIARSVAVGMSKEAELKKLDAQVRIISPTGEVPF